VVAVLLGVVGLVFSYRWGGALGAGGWLAGMLAVGLVGVLVDTPREWFAALTGIGRRGGDADRRPRVGEIWWAAVPFADTDESKDRPCLVVASRGRRISVLKITSADRSGRRDCVELPAGTIDDPTGGARRSWLELKETRPVPRKSFRRLAGHCDVETWRRVGRRRGPDAVA